MKEYKIAYKFANRKDADWSYNKMISFRTLERARRELARLRDKEERDRKAGNSMCKYGGFAIENDYAESEYMIYRIMVCDVTPLDFTDD